MNAHNLQQQRRADQSPNAAGQHRRQPVREIERQSVRILLDSDAAAHCDQCGAAIGARTRYRSVTASAPEGGRFEYSFCDEDCLAARFPLQS